MVGTFSHGSTLSIQEALRLASLQLFAPADVAAKANAAAAARLGLHRPDAELRLHRPDAVADPELSLFAGEDDDDADAPHVLPFPVAASAPAAGGDRPDPEPFTAAMTLPFPAPASATGRFDRAA